LINSEGHSHFAPAQGLDMSSPYDQQFFPSSNLNFLILHRLLRQRRIRFYHPCFSFSHLLLIDLTTHKLIGFLAHLLTGSTPLASPLKKYYTFLQWFPSFLTFGDSLSAEGGLFTRTAKFFTKLNDITTTNKNKINAMYFLSFHIGSKNECVIHVGMTS
jgi:hypothetical protein